MGRLRDFVNEWKARSAGRKFLSRDIHRQARDITGPTGDVFSNAWDLLAKDGDTYLESFDRRVPPSLFVSERDRTRLNIPVPLVERCIEDHGKGDAGKPSAVSQDDPPPPGA